MAKKCKLTVNNKVYDVTEKEFHDYVRPLRKEKKRQERHPTVSFDENDEWKIYQSHPELYEDQDPAVLLYQQELEEAAIKAVGELSPLDQKIWDCLKRNMTEAEISAFLHVAHSTVHDHIARTRKILIEKLKNFI